MNKTKTFKILTILLVMQWAFVKIIAQHPKFIETYYANGIYYYISNILRFIFGWLPFSIGDIFYAVVVIYLIIHIVKLIKTKQINWKNTFFKIGAFISIIYFLFHFNWGLNYYRQSLFETNNFTKEEYSITELQNFTVKLIHKINATQLAITNNDTIKVENPLSSEEIRKIAPLSYQNLAKINSNFTYFNPTVKPSLFSVPLTYMGFAGYLSPLTNEAQVNYLLPKNNIPATTCHEIAHQLGIASEKEANFIGYLAAISSNDSYYNYSGYLMALKYCLFEIYRKDETKFEQLKATINKGILKDMKESQEFWLQYQNWTEPFFKLFYDNYLKANNQELGIDGYNEVVLLLINYYQENDI